MPLAQLTTCFRLGDLSVDWEPRYQQAYDASSFSVAGIITSISFVGGLGDFRPGDYTLSLSTISAGIDTLSTSDFDGNLGPDNQLFTTVSLSGATPIWVWAVLFRHAILLRPGAGKPAA